MIFTSNTLKKDASDNDVLKVTKTAMLVIGVLALVIAIFNKGSIIGILMFSFTLRAGGSFIPYILGHYWKKGSWAGAVASLITGSIGVILVEKKIISFFSLEPIFLGLLLSIVTFVIFTNLSPNPRNSTELVT